MAGPAEPSPMRLRHVTVANAATIPVGSMGLSAGRLARTFATMADEVDILCSGVTPAAGDLHAGVKVVRTEWATRYLPYTPFRAWPGAWHAIGNNAFDLAASRVLRPTDLVYGYVDRALFTFRAARRHGAIRVLHASNTHIEAMRDALNAAAREAGVRQNWISGAMVRKVLAEYREADLIRSQSTLSAETMIQRGVPADKIVVVPPSVDLVRFQPPPNRPGPFTVAFVGSLDIRKGIHHLLAAWDRAAIPEARLVLHGGIGSHDIKVRLAPFRDRQDIQWRRGDVADTYREAHVVVVPSIEDGYALVAIEALASGCPVITTRNTGARDDILDGLNGWVLPVGDVSGIADRLRWLEMHPAELEAMGAAARARAALHTPDAEAAGMLAAVTPVVQRHVRLP